MTDAQVGIEAVGLALPYRRLSGETLRAAGVPGGRDTRSVAAHDQDAVTLAVDAVRRIFPSGVGDAVAGLYLASTTAPLRDGGNAAQVAVGADLDERAFAIDIGGSVAAGAQALLAATHAVRAGAGPVLVVAAEVQTPRPGSVAEGHVGDGAVAILVGARARLATIEGHHTETSGLRERWHLAGERFGDEADAKLVHELGFPAVMSDLARRVLEEEGLAPRGLAVAVHAPDHAGERILSRTLAFLADHMVPDEVTPRIGSLGAAGFPLALVRALAHAPPGERVLVLGPGAGAHALIATAGGGRADVAAELAGAESRTRLIPSYAHYLRLRELLPGVERLEPWSSPALLMREEAALVRWRGRRCTGCDTIDLPPRPACRRCGGHEYEEVRLGRGGSVVTFTRDHLVPSPDPPTLMAVVDLDGGGRYYAELVDAHDEPVQVGRRVGLSFRLLHRGGGFPNYGWKLALDGDVEEATGELERVLEGA